MANDQTGAMARTRLTAVVLCAVLTFALPCVAGVPTGPDQALQSLQAMPPAAGMVLTSDDANPRDRRPDRDRSQAPRNGPPRGQPGHDARGQTLQPQQRGQALGDYRRFRLRTPPPGYSWRRVGDEAYLVSDETGTVTETVPLGH